jgi:hypothetical protein
LDIPIDSSNNLVVAKPSIGGMQNQLEDDESSLLELPFEFEEDIFEDYGNTSNYPIQVRPQAKTTPFEPHEESMAIEHIQSLLAIMSYEWLTQVELSPEVTRITFSIHHSSMPS